jgi:hypothetical protein
MITGGIAVTPGLEYVLYFSLLDDNYVPSNGESNFGYLRADSYDAGSFVFLNYSDGGTGIGALSQTSWSNANDPQDAAFFVSFDRVIPAPSAIMLLMAGISGLAYVHRRIPGPVVERVQCRQAAEAV